MLVFCILFVLATTNRRKQIFQDFKAMNSHCLIKTNGNLNYNNLVSILILGENKILNMETKVERCIFLD